MFRFSERVSSGKPGESRRYLRRAGLFAGGLLLLWVALQLVPSPEAPADTAVYADDTGAVASNLPLKNAASRPGLISWGNIAALLVLGGGGGIAYYLHRRSKGGPKSPSPIHSLGELAIGQNQQLRLVKCGEEILLLGVTTGQINLLRSYQAEDFAESESEYEVQHIPVEPSFKNSPFANVLRQYAGRYVSPTRNGKL
ncbi:MAG: flagellar biosynthetic protein FliO [Rhodothermales bacterium]